MIKKIKRSLQIYRHFLIFKKIIYYNNSKNGYLY